ncbi:MAG: type I-E CRISPR-associated protein Cse2/CasB [Rhodobacteraceae bacterium]|nr:type I-E CRISPR-associated protein Cse2/CasB [Paracoccaceae bacterium]
MSKTQGRGATIAQWWRDNLAARDSGRARALAARLRRADMTEALAQAEVHALARRIGLGRHPADAARLARLVQVLAHLREDAGQSLAARLGGPDPKLSNLRFQRLLRAEGDDLTTALRRALPMVDRRCNVARLGQDMLNWDHPEWGDRVRAEWCFDYFGAPPPQTAAETHSTEVSS